MTEASATPLTDSHSRRTLLAVAAGALAAGAGLAWWRYGSGASPQFTPQALWEAGFERPDGAELKLADFKGRPLVINFWATWCTPCVEEMPLLNNFYQENKAKSWQMMGLAIDQPSAVRRFLAQHPVEYPVGLAGLNGTELMTLLGNEAGGLPFTIVINAQGAVLMRKLGKLSQADIGDWT